MDDEFLQFAQKAIIIKNNNLLIIKKSGLDKNQPFKYDLPGGRKKENENLDEHIKREVKEEVDLDIMPKDIFNMWEFKIIQNDKPTTVIAVSRFCDLMNDTISITEKEINSYEWVPINQNLLNYNFIPGIKSVVEKLIKNIKTN